MIISINISPEVGTRKYSVKEAYFKEGEGIKGDAHAGKNNLRQVSLLAWEDIRRFSKELKLCLKPGDFAENITTFGINLKELNVGDELRVGEEVILKVTQIGKYCDLKKGGCSVFKNVGKCIMPTLGVFAEVKRGGIVRFKDKLRKI